MTLKQLEAGNVLNYRIFDSFEIKLLIISILTSFTH